MIIWSKLFGKQNGDTKKMLSCIKKTVKENSKYMKEFGDKISIAVRAVKAIPDDHDLCGGCPFLTMKDELSRKDE